VFDHAVVEQDPVSAHQVARERRQLASWRGLPTLLIFSSALVSLV
jgi:hypothetical protein